MNIFDNDIIEEEASIFRCSEVFRFDYIPETLFYRDNQLKTIASYCRGIKKGRRPVNMELTGGFATGKTTAIKTLFNKLEDVFDNVICVHVNCQSFVTSFQIVSHIYQKIFNKDVDNFASTSFAYDRIMNHIVEENRILMVALDDYNHIKKLEDLNKIFYSLLRAGEIFDNAKVSLVTITNCDGRMRLDPNVQTTFYPLEIDFPQYTFSQMYAILKERCEIGFHHGVVDDDVIEKIASISFDEGNLRYGISLLDHAGQQAETHNSKKILEKYIY